MAWQAKPNEAGTAPPKRYFAYSVSLDPDFRAQWRSASGASFPKLEGEVAQLAGYELVYRSFHPRWGGRIAGLETGGAHVYGKLFEVPAAQWALIEELENSLEATPVEVEVTVGGQRFKATAFVPRPRGPADSLVSESFVAAVVRGATEAHLPSGYVGRLAAEASILEAVQRFGREQLGVKS
jgi:hypothetical protein